MRQVAQQGAGATGAGPHLAFRFCGVAVRPCCTASPNVTGPGTHTAPQAGGVCAWLGPQPAPRVSERVPGPLPAGPLGPCPRLRLLGQRGLRRRVACVHGPPILSVTARVSGGRTRTVRARPRGRKGTAGRAVPQDSGARVTNAGRPRQRGTLPEAGQGRALWPHTSDGWLCSGSPVVGGGFPGGDPGLHWVPLAPSLQSQAVWGSAARFPLSCGSVPCGPRQATGWTRLSRGHRARLRRRQPGDRCCDGGD